MRSHPLLFLVFSPKLEEERMGKGASKNGDQHMGLHGFGGLAVIWF